MSNRKNRKNRDKVDTIKHKLDDHSVSLVSNKDIATVPISTPPNQAEAPMCNIDVSVIFTWGVYFSSDMHITGYYDLLILL
jgi:hypothetical protein